MNIESVETKFRTNSHFVFNCKYHVIFCPKYRRRILVGAIADRLETIMKSVANDLNSEIVDVEIMEDHVHAIIDCDPSHGITKVIREIKGTSTRILHKEFPELKTRISSVWTRSAFIATAGDVPLSAVKQYIMSQKTRPDKKDK